MSDKQGLHCFVEGMVQGVGFRYFTQQVASSLGLVGYVRNLPDGRVEAYAEGEPVALNQFLIRLKRGPGFAQVVRVEEQWRNPTGDYASFRITR